MKCHPWSGGLSSCALALPLSLVPRADASAPRGARSSAPASRRTDDLARLALLSLLRRFAPACARRPRIRSGWPGASVAATSGLSSPVLTVNSIISAHFKFFFAIVEPESPCIHGDWLSNHCLFRKTTLLILARKGARLESQPEEKRQGRNVAGERCGVRREILIGRALNDAIVRYVA